LLRVSKDRLRFFDGIYLRTNADFGAGFSTALTLVGSLGGAVVLSKPAMVKVRLPSRVREVLPDNLHTETETLWRLGDQPLSRAA